MNINKRIEGLRALMKKYDMDAYLVPTADPHQSEYVAEHYESRKWVSGFTGSAGTVVITYNEAILWTDGRYFTQAEKELENSEIQLYKMGIPGYPTYTEWLAENLEENSILGFDSRLISQSQIEKIEEKLGSKNISYKGDVDLIDKLWVDRPELPKTKLFIHNIKYTGYRAKEKIEKVREKMKEESIDYHLIAGLDDIAWLYNIRGRDIKFNPVSISYALLGLDKAYLCIDEEKLTEDVREYLKDNNILLRDYEEIASLLASIDKGKTIYLDKSKVNSWLYNSINKGAKILHGRDITTVLKGRKNKVEIENQKNAYIKDGLAMTRLFYWIDVNKSKKDLNEFLVQEKLEELREEYEDYIEPSFASISAYGENAAMMHYSASKESYSSFKNKGMYLLDAGGQYLDGTTDTTRTIAIGEVSEEEKKDFTYTLKSHINLINARFLEGTDGYKLDAIARYPLWQIGSDYKCGTGHGVGYLLNVHEGPHSISARYNDVALEEGMVVTVEPGVYKPGKHGIRIENVAVVREDIETDSGKFLSFELLSFVPIDLDCIDKKYLSRDEIKWLNTYHEEVYNKLSKYMFKEEKEWLRNKTRSI